MGPISKSSPGYATKWLPLSFALITVVALLLVAWLQPEPVIGEVLSVREGADGVFHATVRFQKSTDAGFETVVESMVLPPRHIGAETVPVWPGNDWSRPEIGLVGFVEVSPPFVAWAAAAAALLGFVVMLTNRGAGYVPGTGEPGQTRPELVAEDRGFYWRT